MKIVQDDQDNPVLPDQKQRSKIDKDDQLVMICKKIKLHQNDLSFITSE